MVSDENLGRPDGVVELLKDYLFLDAKIGLLDLHPRDDVFEPAQCGGFVTNGGRLYIDAVGSHLEYATAECQQLKDLVANDRAGQRLILRAIEDLELSDGIDVYNNSIDHFGGHTFGCHENYLVRGGDDFLSRSVLNLYPFLSTRQIFSGVGRVGGHILAEGGRPDYAEVVENPVDYIWVGHIYSVFPDPTVHFQLSQRADHILKAMASRVRFNRAMINPKWEHLYSYEGCTRLHLLFGEANQNEYAYALKIGTTSMVIRMLEEDRVPHSWVLEHPVIALREVSRDPKMKWKVRMQDGSTIGSIDLQRGYLEIGQKYKGESEETDWVLREWESVLDGLEKDPMQMGDRIDWVAKKSILEQYMGQEGTDWSDDALHSVDLEYHNIDPEKSLFYGLQETGGTRRFVSDSDIVAAMDTPPSDTRANARAQLVQRLLGRKGRKAYAIDWSGVATDARGYYDLSDPFDPQIPPSSG